MQHLRRLHQERSLSLERTLFQQQQEAARSIVGGTGGREDDDDGSRDDRSAPTLAPRESGPSCGPGPAAVAAAPPLHAAFTSADSLLIASIQQALGAAGGFNPFPMLLSVGSAAALQGIRSTTLPSPLPPPPPFTPAVDELASNLLAKKPWDSTSDGGAVHATGQCEPPKQVPLSCS